jgi:hypothetical protein
MKKIILTRVALLLVLIILAELSYGQDRQKWVTVYTDDYHGNSYQFGVGRYDNIYLAQSGIPVVYSVKVPPGMKATLYSEDDFKGESLVLTEDAPTRYLKSKGFAEIGLTVSLIVEEVHIADPADEEPMVTLYKDDFAGASKKLAPGQYEFAEFGNIDNDQLSSIKIPKGMKVILYEHSGFSGKSLTLTTDTRASYLVKNKFNDAASSLVVEAAPEPLPVVVPVVVAPVVTEPDPVPPTPEPLVGVEESTGPVIIFQGDFTGLSKNLKPGRYDIDALGVGNDELSSVKVPHAFRVTLYEHDGWTGRALVLTQNSPTAFLADNNFNNVTSSLMVEVLPEVTIYQGDFSGASKSFGPGRYGRDSLGIGNDELSSVKVPPGMRVTLYEDKNFQWSSLVLTEDANTAFLSKSDFNNKTSSLIVEQIENVMPMVTLYQDDFAGPSKSLPAGRYDYANMGIGNNSLSSIRIPRGFRVTLYEHAAFEGRTLELRRDAHTDLLIANNFNDVATSMVVEQIPPSDLVVTLFRDSYSGVSLTVTPGRYTADHLANSIGDNQLSSALVPEGMRAILFEDDHFTGRSVTLEVKADFSGIKSFNDHTSSVIVEDIVASMETTEYPVDPVVTPAVVVPVAIPVVTEQPATVEYTYNKPCMMTPEEYAGAVKAIASKPFSDDKMSVARLATKDKCMTNDQIGGIAKLFDWDEQRLEFVKDAYELATEKTTYYQLDEVFKFMSSKDAFTKFLSAK